MERNKRNIVSKTRGAIEGQLREVFKGNNELP